MIKSGYVPTEFYFWTLKFEFDIIFTCHNTLFFKKNFQPLNNTKGILSSQAVQEKVVDFGFWFDV